MKKDKIETQPIVTIDLTDVLTRNGRQLPREALARFIERLPVPGEIRNQFEWENKPLPEYFKVSLENTTHQIQELSVERKGDQVRYMAKVKPANTDLSRSMFELIDKKKAEFGIRAVGIQDGDKFTITNLITFDIVNKG